MVCGILHTDQVSVGPAVQVSVLSTDVAIAGEARLALAAEHGVGEVAQVVAAGVLVAVMGAVHTGVTRCANLGRREQKFVRHAIDLRSEKHSPALGSNYRFA